MNQQERNELRAEHVKGKSPDHELCDGCYYEYPCDTIRVLDAWESTPARVLQPERTNGSVSLAGTDTVATDTIHADTTECPPEGQSAECGEKL